MNKPKPLLLLGGSGWIGGCLLQALSEASDLFDVLTSYSQHQPSDQFKSFKFNYNSPEQFFEIVDKFEPRIIINALAGVDETLYKLHINMVEYAKNNHVYYVYISSSMVFDADLAHPHHEHDLIGAESEYGKFKQRCEEAMSDSMSQAAIFRLSAVHGWNPNKESRTERFLHKLQSGQTISVDKNVFQNRLTVIDLAQTMAEVVKLLAPGIFHLGTVDSNEEVVFLTKLAQEFGYDASQVIPVESKLKILTTIPDRTLKLLGNKFQKTETQTLSAIAKIPALQKYKKL